MFLLMVYLLLALCMSFLCSILEAVLLSSTPSYLNAQKEKGQKGAKLLIEYKENVDKPLSAILSVNTIAHTIGAAGVGAQATKIFGESSFGIVSAVLTILILIFSEIIPKTLGARYWKGLSPFTASMIKFMIIISYPLVKMSKFVTSFISSEKIEHTTSREEISALAKIGVEEGIFGENENKIIQNLIKLKGVKVYEVMTPRVVVTVADEEMTLEEFASDKSFLHFSRIPIYSKSPDNVTGYIHRQSVFDKLSDGETNLKLKNVSRQLSVLPSAKSLLKAWEYLLENKQHIALIIDEYGGMDGIVTMEDIIETLLGFEIVDESDAVPDMQKYAKERWKSRKIKYNYLDTNKDELST